jgi:Lon protease-like protein
MLANVEFIPDQKSLTPAEETAVRQGADATHRLAQQYLQEGKVEPAWNLLTQQQ